MRRRLVVSHLSFLHASIVCLQWKRNFHINTLSFVGFRFHFFHNTAAILATRASPPRVCDKYFRWRDAACVRVCVCECRKRAEKKNKARRKRRRKLWNWPWHKAPHITTLAIKISFKKLYNKSDLIKKKERRKREQNPKVRKWKKIAEWA